MTSSNGAMRTETMRESLFNSNKFAPSADRFFGFSEREEKGIVLPETSASTTGPPKRWNGSIPWWLKVLWLFIQCISALHDGNRVAILLCAGIVFYTFFGDWIEKIFWPSCENRAIEEATGEMRHVDATA